MCTEGIQVLCQSTPLIDVLDRHSINTLVDTESTVRSESTNLWSMHMRWLTLSRLSVDRVLIKCSLDHLSIKMWIECQSAVNLALFGMSSECGLRCQLSVDHRSVEGIDWHLTVNALSTHAPKKCMPASKYLILNLSIRIMSTRIMFSILWNN